jgi:hypothetical protein
MRRGRFTRKWGCVVGLVLTAAMLAGCTAAKSESQPVRVDTPAESPSSAVDSSTLPEADEPTVANVLGNTTGNIANAGFIAQQGNWLFYLGAQGGGLCKIRTDGTGREKLNDDSALYINVVGDWVYYVEDSDSWSGAICRVRTDGSDQSVLNGDVCQDLYVAGDWMYYTDQSKDFATYRARLDGSGEMLVSSETMFGMNVVDDWIYYYTGGDGANYAYKVRANGTGQMSTLTQDDVTGNLVVADGWVYYLTTYDYYLCRVKTDGTGRMQLNSTPTGFFTVSGNSVFYGNSDDGEALYVMNTDGSGQARFDDVYTDSINVVDGWVYVLKADGLNTDGLYGIKADGTDRRTLQ